MAEPEEIAQVVEAAVAPQDLAGRSVLVSAGPTREPVDPVRVLTNRSSGRMGYALARAAAARGARVVLVSGPVELAAPWGVERVGVETAAEMAEAVLARAAEVDVVIMAAAVADFRPVAVRPEKIKKDAGLQAIELARTTDILAALAQRDVPRVRVGFAAETEDLLAAARRKLSAKRLAMIVANRVGVPGTGFDSDENEAYLVVRGAEDEPVHVPRTSKMHLAHAILDHVAALMRAP
jgi:phosphopantothenoylcysteine decarboxylase/phosphopantothenate--cysteine ligase